MAGCGPIRPSKRGKWRALVLILVHVAIAAHVLHWFYGGETLTPVEPSESMQTLELGKLNAGFLLFVATLLGTAIFGRFFCGWACHLLALQDLCAWLLGRVGLKPKPVRSRLLVFVPIGAALYMFVWPTLRRVFAGLPAPDLEVHLTTRDFWETFPGPAISILTFLVCGGLVVWWLGSKGFCTYGCPYGGFFGVVDRVAPGRIRVNDNCDGCAHCTAVCTSNVRVHEEVKLFKMVVDSGCMKCMDCVSSCPKDALSFGFGKPMPFQQPRRTYSFTWGEDLAMAAVFLAALFTFRELYSAVPFLLAIGLSVLTATLAVTGVRMWRSKTVTWQHLALKKVGGLTRSGRLAVGLVAVWLGFTAHSGLVQFHTWRGSARLGAALRTPPGPEQDRLALGSESDLGAAASLGVAFDPRVEYGLAQLTSRRGDLPGAEVRLRRVLGANSRDVLAALTLANVIAAQGRLRDAEGILQDLVGRVPTFRPASVRLDALRAEIAARGR